MIEDTGGQLGKKLEKTVEPEAEQKNENVVESKERSKSKEKSSRKHKEKKSIRFILLTASLFFKVPLAICIEATSNVTVPSDFSTVHCDNRTELDKHQIQKFWPKIYAALI